MQNILIPPIPHLQMSSGRRYHLLLSHLMAHRRYREFYFTEALKGSYIILDNSAHEFGTGQDVEKLVRDGEDVLAQELVIPDSLANRGVTEKLAGESVQILAKRGKPVPKLMFVAQGENYDELCGCLRTQVYIAEMFWKQYPTVFGQPPTLGVSKDYHEEIDGGLGRFLREELVPAADRLGADIHLLGWVKSLWDLGDLAVEFGQRVRTTDSARPFVYAAAEIDLRMSPTVPPYPKRNPDYFFSSLSKEQLAIASKNIQVYDDLASRTS